MGYGMRRGRKCGANIFQSRSPLGKIEQRERCGIPHLLGVIQAFHDTHPTRSRIGCRVAREATRSAEAGDGVHVGKGQQPPNGAGCCGKGLGQVVSACRRRTKAMTICFMIVVLLPFKRVAGPLYHYTDRWREELSFLRCVTCNTALI